MSFEYFAVREAFFIDLRKLSKFNGPDFLFSDRGVTLCKQPYKSGENEIYDIYDSGEKLSQHGYGFEDLSDEEIRQRVLEAVGGDLNFWFGALFKGGDSFISRLEK